MKIRNNILLMLLSSTFLSSNCWAEATFDPSSITSDYFKLEKTTGDSESADIVKIGEDSYKITFLKTQYEQDGNFAKNTAHIIDILNQEILYKYNLNEVENSRYTPTYDAENITRETIDVSTSYGPIFDNDYYTHPVINNLRLDAIQNRNVDYYYTYGGAIYNGGYGIINKLEGIFIKNEAYENYSDRYSDSHGDPYQAYGGAIYNKGIISNIDASFLGNDANATNIARGGAIANFSDVGNITGVFWDNYAKSRATGVYSSSEAFGGAIYNSTGSVIDDITADFANNYTEANFVYGGAIANHNGSQNYEQKSQIGSLKGNFINNYAKSYVVSDSETGAQGGFLFNFMGKTGNISGNLIGNFAQAGSWAYGGAIANKNSSNIQDINADFYGNHATADNTYGAAYGGAIYNYNGSVIGNITGNFGQNYVKGASAIGGAIINWSSSTGNISGTFADNMATGITNEGSAQGGAIFNINFASLGDINADFSNNIAQADSWAYGGAIANKNSAEIQNITGDFYKNQAKGNNTSSSAFGGAIYSNNTSSIGNITGEFDQNNVNAVVAFGGAIYNSSSSIENIKSKFTNNTANGTTEAGGAQGGAILNIDTASVKKINADFSNNIVQADSWAYGGAIANKNSSRIKNITGNFSQNQAKGGDTNSSALGGAIYNYNTSNINEIIGEFNQNTVEGVSAYGGAIINWSSTIEEISGNFTENTATGVSEVGGAQGGAILNVENASLGAVDADFSGNIAQAQNWSYGGAIANKSSSIKEIFGNFNNNAVISSKKYSAAHGGAIYNDSQIDTIEGVFDNNYAETTNEVSSAYGGAIYNKGSIGKIYNSDFTNNSTKGVDAKGGAIYSETDLLIETRRYDSVFSGNKANDVSNAIYMQGSDSENINLTLLAHKNGSITFNDAVDGVNYNINIDGDTTGIVIFNEKFTGLANLNLNGDSILNIGLNANIEVGNIIANTPTTYSSILNTASTDYKTLQVDVDVAYNKMNNGLIKVSGDIVGSYGVIINALKSQYSTDISVFLEALNDDLSTESEFSVLRVKGSPYMWKTVLNANGETQGSTWYLDMERNTDQSIIISPEVFTGIGLHEAAIEQTRNVVRNVANKVTETHTLCSNCGIVSDTWDGSKGYNAWVITQGDDINIEKPVAMEGKIWGIEAGFDLQHDINNALGVFASYRNGEYDLSGKGSKYTSGIGSSIALDSYLAGLYYRHDKNNSWLFSTIYAGMQDAKIDTNDNVVNFNTDGIEFGASAEFGHSFVLNKNMSLSPSLAVKYNQISFDDATDNVYKHYNWDDIKHFEIEMALALEKRLENGKVYFKPSVIQSLTHDDNVSVSDLGNIGTYKDGTLGRIEVGGYSYFNNNISSYGWTNYTYGANYDAIALGLGISYNW